MNILDWWGRELHELCDPVVRHLETEKLSALLRIHDGRTEAVVLDAKGVETRRVTIASTFGNLDSEQQTELRSVVASAEVGISLPDNEVCVLKLRHVGSSVPNRESLRYRLLQDSPIDIAQIAFTWRHHPAGKSGNDDGAYVEVALCRREYLNRIIEAAESYRIPATAIGFAQPGSNRLKFAFPIRQTKDWAFSVKAHLNKALFLGLFSLPVVAMALVGGIAKVELRTTKQELDAQRSVLQATEGLMRRQAESNAVYGALEHIAATPSVVNTLNELGRLLPLNTWVTEIRLEGRSLNLIGLSADPTAAAKAIAPSRLISDIRLGSVSSLNPSNAAAQFEITATLITNP